MKLVVIGATGMLGRDMVVAMSQKGWEVVPFGSAEIDITTPHHIRNALEEHTDIQWLVNCAAFTQVDDAETKTEQAYAVNTEGVANLARWCLTHHVPLIHYSTDYVFDGALAEPYTENEAYNPINGYGLSKLGGEVAMKTLLNDYYLLRVQWLYGDNGPNFVKSILRLASDRPEISIVSDQWGSPTSTKEIARMTCELIEKKPEWGTYHMAASGYTTWYNYAKKIIELSQGFCSVKPIPTEGYPRPAKRPKNSRLNCEKLQALGIVPKHWEDELKAYIIQGI